VAIKTGTRDVPSADSAAGINAPCSGRPAQEQQMRAKAKAPAARNLPGVLAARTVERQRLSRKMEESRDNGQRPDTRAVFERFH
jgi:hypothetical protein